MNRGMGGYTQGPTGWSLPSLSFVSCPLLQIFFNLSLCGGTISVAGGLSPNIFQFLVLKTELPHFELLLKGFPQRPLRDEILSGTWKTPKKCLPVGPEGRVLFLKILETLGVWGISKTNLFQQMVVYLKINSPSGLVIQKQLLQLLPAVFGMHVKLFGIWNRENENTSIHQRFLNMFFTNRCLGEWM